MILKPCKDFFLLNNSLNEQINVEFIFTTRTLFFSAGTSLCSTYFKYKFYTYKKRILKHRVVKSSTSLKLKLRGLELEFSLFTQPNYCKTLKSKNLLEDLLTRTYIPYMYIVQYVHLVLKFCKNLTKNDLLCFVIAFFFTQFMWARTREGRGLSYRPARAGIFKKSMGARHRGGIGFSYRPARLHRLAEFIPWHQFRGPINI